jgi:hypothetical protein
MSVSLIILRLCPKTPTDGTSFTGYLTGLSITVSDMSVKNPEGKSNPIGTAFYDPANPASTIVQHFMPTLPPGQLAAVATAAIVVTTPPGYPEYDTSDLRLAITRETPTGTETLVDANLDYNVAVDTSQPLPALGDAAGYASLGPTALYLALPPGGAALGAHRAYVDIPNDGSPPNYDQLYNAVVTVLKSDPGAQPDMDALIRSLTVAQCRHVAAEIVWNRKLSPLPAPPPSDSLEQYYTAPGSSNFDDQRQQFEGNLTAYYAENNAQVDVLAKYVYALAAALACQKMTDDATQAGFQFPVLPGTTSDGAKVAQASVILSG